MSYKYKVSQTIPIPPREVYTATGKVLEALPVPKPKRRNGRKPGIDATWLGPELKMLEVSRKDFAKSIGVTTGAVDAWCSGRRKISKKYLGVVNCRLEEEKRMKDHVEQLASEGLSPSLKAPEKVERQAPEPKKDYKGDPIRIARKKALQMLPAEWGDAKQVAFLAGVEAMEEAIMEELG